MNKLLILIMLILCSILVLAEEKTEIIDIINLEHCNDLTVKILSEPLDQIDNIKLLNCKPTTKYIWKCNCNNNYNLKAIKNENTNAIFNFALQYYFEKPKTQKELNLSESKYNDYLYSLKRLKNINDFQITNGKKQFNIFKFLESDNTPNNEGKFIIIVIVIILLLFLIGIIFLGWYLLKDDFSNNKNLKDEIDDLLNEEL